MDEKKNQIRLQSLFDQISDYENAEIYRQAKKLESQKLLTNDTLAKVFKDVTGKEVDRQTLLLFAYNFGLVLPYDGTVTLMSPEQFSRAVIKPGSQARGEDGHIESLITRQARAGLKLEDLLAAITLQQGVEGVTRTDLQALIKQHLTRSFAIPTVNKFAAEHGIKLAESHRGKESIVKPEHLPNILGLANKYANREQLTYPMLNDIIEFVTGSRYESAQSLYTFARDYGLQDKITHLAKSGQKKRTHGHEDTIREEALRRALGSRGLTYHELNNIVYKHTSKYYKSMGALWKLAQRAGIPMRWDYNGDHLRSRMSSELLSNILAEARDVANQNKLTATKLNKIIHSRRGLAMEDYELQVFAMDHKLRLIEEAEFVT